MANETLFLIWSFITGIFLLRLTYIHLRFSRGLVLLRNVKIDANRFWPTVSLIVPACNEANTIGPALESLLKMDYPGLEIIAVNDRSTDGTENILKNLALKFPKLKVVNIDSLPPGWLGKVNALEQGRQLSSGEWLLFSDADVHYGPQSLKKAIAYSVDNGLDYLTITPSMHAKGYLLRACIVQFTKVLIWSLDFKRLADSEDRQALGIGAFNLVRRSAFTQSRGFEWLRLEVIDDTGLASMMKEDGASLGVLGGLDEIQLEWYPTFWSFVRGLEKNAFSVFQFSYLAVLLNAAVTWLLFFGIFLAPMASGSSWVIGFMAVCFSAYLASAYRALNKLIPFHLGILWFSPFVQILFPLIAMRATALFAINGGIRWRGTFYSKMELKENQRLKLLNQLSNRKFPKTKQT